MRFAKLNFLSFVLLLTSQPLFSDIDNGNFSNALEANLEVHQEDICEDDCETNHCLHYRHANTISIGPEIYQVRRAAGTKQKGDSAGVRFTYDRIKRYHYYLGAQVFYGTGILRGHTSAGDKIRSRFTQKQVEGNIGYTFQLKSFPHVSFTPFAGYGYLKDINKFSPPTNLQATFTNQFRYASFGFLSSVYVFPCFTVGVNARFKWPWQTRCKVTDPFYPKDVRLIVKDKLHYRIELPFTYFGSLLRDHFEVAVVPFYEERLYGGRENFPFDFYETKYTLYGVNVQLIYRF